MYRQEYLLKIDDIPDVQNVAQMAMHRKFSGIISQVVSDNNRREMVNEEIAMKQMNFTRSPLVLSANQWHHSTTPLIKINSDLNSSNDEIRNNYEKRLTQEINFCHHLKACGSIYVKPNGVDPEVLGKFLVERLGCAHDFMIEIPLINPRNFSNLYRLDKLKEDGEFVEEDDTWNYWNKIHMAANYNVQIHAAIVLSSDMPSNELVVYRWLGEPVSMLVIPHNCFVMNKSNYPVMNKRQQEVVRLFMQYAKSVIVIDPKSAEIENHLTEYMDYLQHQTKFLEYNEHFAEQDQLRFPLQPLYDNLDTGTYETFEKDPKKYILYQKAIESALLDFVPDAEKETKTIILMIVGAGRGPLIRSALNASTNTQRKIKILAVEKNPNAIVTLSCLIRDMWYDKGIELIAQDMRKIELKEKADILVSELLGSFGDNELSPECLDGVQHLLKPTGISIPYISKSYIQPVMTKRNYGKIQKKINGTGIREDSRGKYSEPLEVNWLIYMANVFHIDVSKELFTFVHPNKDVPIDNTRNGKLEFEAPIDCILHGFAGYFTSQLYKDIEISIEPSTHTQGMQSWYSVFFPISKQVQLKRGDKIVVEYWRKVDEVKCWYEWQLVAPETTIVQNLNGEIHPILL